MPVLHNNTRTSMIFVVGSSRSGTTLLGRILGNHPDVFTFHELHFFEQLWSTHDQGRLISSQNALDLAARLLCIQRHGYLTQHSSHVFIKEAENIIQSLQEKEMTSLNIFAAFLHYETSKNGKIIPCDQTPRNVFYLTEILSSFPEARIVIMIRDPRDVLLSQKRRWKRRFLGAKNFPLTATLRSWVNYHPFIISKIWNSSMKAADRFVNDPRVFCLHFERLLAHPEESVRNLCTFIGLTFTYDMLDVPHIGSSSDEDHPERRGIKKQRIGSWKNGGLNSTEIYFCQKINNGFMKRFDYNMVNINPSLYTIFYYILIFPIRLFASFLLNIHRMKSIRETIIKRLG